MQIINRETALVGVDTLRPHPRNVNQGNIGLIGESIGQNGFYGSLVVQQSTGHILRGNHTWQAARQAGATEIPVTYVDVDDETALRILLVDNRATREGVDDSNALAVLLQELAATPASLAGTGYDGDALDELLADLGQGQTELAGDPDAVPELPAEPITKRGDVITLGRHRLMCGDAYDREAVAALLDGVSIGLVLMDPPYGVALHTDFAWSRTNEHKGIKASRGYAPIVGDDRPFDYGAFAWLDCPEQFWWGADYYVDSLPSCGKDGAWLVWDKKSDDLGTAWLHDFELLWSKQRHRRQVLRVLWHGALGTESEDTKRRIHPTQKPVRVLTPIIEQHSLPGAHALDLFAGSGSLLVACEQLGRRAYLMEIEPAYCDVIVQRWQDLTGKTAVREQIANHDDARVLTG